MSDSDLVQRFIDCLSDPYIQVRRRDGTLLGVLPAPAEGANAIFLEDGRACDIMQGIIYGVVVEDDVDPRRFGSAFIARAGVNLDPPLASDGSVTPSHDPE